MKQKSTGDKNQEGGKKQGEKRLEGDQNQEGD